MGTRPRARQRSRLEARWPAAQSVHLPCICHAYAMRLPCVRHAYAVYARYSFAAHAQVAADGAKYMVWSMKAEAEEAAGALQEASRSYIKAAALCKACGDTANQQILAARARSVLGRLRT